MRDIARMSATLLEVVRAWVEPAFSALRERIERMDARLNAIPAGPQGERGSDGRDGAPGKSAYNAALDAGFVFLGGEKEWLESLRGPQGTPGERGAEGPQGQAGPSGESVKGDRGEKGDAGPAPTVEQLRELVLPAVERAVSAIPIPKDGERGPPGLNGKDAEPYHPDTVRAMLMELVSKAVSDLPKAQDGAPGRDAAQIDYRDGIDEAKSYPRGTHALYRGGVIVALRATDPIDGDILKAGWAVAQNGLHEEVDEDFDSGRVRRTTKTFTDGKVALYERKTAIQLYRGIWINREYERGDIVTRGGSQWYCDVDRTDAPPDTGSTDWKLCVKRGTNGKDGKDGERGTPGPEGKPGTRYS